jgi:hypothetical protein
MIEPPERVKAEELMSGYTTVGTGGPAEFFSRAGSGEELSALIGWAAASGLHLFVIGSGSNLLVADEGVRGLVVKLDGDLAPKAPLLSQVDPGDRTHRQQPHEAVPPVDDAVDQRIPVEEGLPDPRLIPGLSGRVSGEELSVGGRGPRLLLRHATKVSTRASLRKTT